MIRFSVMNRLVRASLAAALVLSTAGAALAQVIDTPAPTPSTTLLDTGAFAVFDHGRLVGREEFAYGASGDSIVVSANHVRPMRRADGTEKSMSKKLLMVVDGFDFGLRSYTSNAEFDGHSTIKGLLPGDTTMTYYSEVDGGGNADRLAQPAGRIFILDPMLFTLFDVIGRNVHGRAFQKRPIQMVVLGKQAEPVEGLVTNAGPDTLRWGGRLAHVRRYTLTDPSANFTFWLSERGQMLRLENRESDLVVTREPDAAAAPKPRSAPVKRRVIAKAH